MKTAALAVYLIAAAIAIVPPVIAQQIGSVNLTNLISTDAIRVSNCVGPDGQTHGPVIINSNESHMWSFPLNVLSKGWTCHFEWLDTSGSCPLSKCPFHYQNVNVFPGLLSPFDKADVAEPGALINILPCYDCIWKITKVGFYSWRRDAYDEWVWFNEAIWDG